MAEASRTVTLRVIGDTAGATGALSRFGDAAEQHAGRGRAAFSAVSGSLSGLSGAFGPVLEVMERVGGGMDTVGEHGRRVGTVLLGMGAAATGAGVMLQMAASRDVEAHNQLKAAVEATGRSFEEFEPSVEKAVQGQVKFGHTAVDTQEALRKLTQGTQDPERALSLLGVTADLAAAKHISLAEASGIVVKVSAGAGKVLKEFGLHLDGVGTKAEQGSRALEQLAERLHGQASAAADSFGGRLRALTAGAENFVAVMGQKFGAALTVAGPALMGLGAIIEMRLIPNIAAFIASGFRMVAMFVTMTAAAVAEGQGLTVLAAIASTTAATIVAATAGVAAVIAVGVLAWSEYSNAIHKVREAFAQAEAPAKQFPNDLSAINTSMNNVKEVTAQASEAFHKHSYAIIDTIVANKAHNEALKLSKQAMADLQGQQERLTTNTEALARANGMSKESVVDLANKLHVNLSGSLVDADDAFRKYLGASGPVNEANRGMAEAAKVLGDANSSAADKVKALKTEFDFLTGKHLSVVEAEIAMQKSTESLSSALSAGSGQWDIHTKAGMANTEAMIHSIKTAEAVRVAEVDAGGSVEEAGRKYNAQISSLEANMRAAGATEQQIKNLTGTVQRVPGEVPINVHVDGAESAIDALVRVADAARAASGAHDINVGYSAPPQAHATGGFIVPGIGNQDTVPAMLTPGEYVLTKDQVAAAFGGSGGGGGDVYLTVNGWVGNDQAIAGKVRDELLRMKSRGVPLGF